MSFPRYPKYKDSGVEWLGQMPEHWEVRPLRRLAREEQTAFIDGDWIESPYITDEGVRLIQTGNVGLGFYKEQGFRYVSPETFKEFDCTEIHPGDILICRLAEPVGRACLAPKLDSPMITSVDVCILKSRPEVNAKFVVYMLSSAQYLGFMEGQCRGGTRDRVSRTFLGSVRVSLPPSSEQSSIAAFLDRETAKIDALVTEQQRLMELLKEKRQAVISHAVTKGLNPRAAMKPSGIDWLGNVPEHWAIPRLCYNAAIENGTTPSRDNPEYWLGGDIPWLSSGEVNQYRITQAQEFITQAALNECSLRLLPVGTIVAGMIGQGKTRGLSASLEIEATINQNLAAIVPGKNLIPDYLLYIFQSVYEYLREFGRGGNQAALNCEILSALRIPLPPPQEQSQICALLNSRLQEFDTLTAEAQRAIDLLQERRTALISAAVTGQIDVRKT